MKIKSTMRRKLTIFIFVGCLIPFLIGGVYLNWFIKSDLIKNNIEHTNQILSQVSVLINKTLISDRKEEVHMLATLDSVQNSELGINNYTSYNPDTFVYHEFPAEKAIEENFKVLMESHDTTNFIFLGTETGGYMEYPRFSPDNSYDPRQRPWYQKTIQQDDIIISEPYITKVTKEMVVSITKPVKKGEDIVGVVGVSVNLEELTNSINKIKVGESGYILVLSRENRFIVSPKHPEWILKTPKELGLDCFQLPDPDGRVYEAYLDGVPYVFNCIMIDDGLHIISVTDKNEIIKRAQYITKILIAIYIITFILIFFTINFVAKHMTRSILEISNVIKRMTHFDFEDNEGIRRYTRRTDEIGTVSTALVNMHDNYLELMEQVDSMDEEIKNIDIVKQHRFKLGLSEQNPFRGIMNSINVLLEKNYSYFDQLKTKNKEISLSNELLTATEEELKAQLEEINQQKEYINFQAYHDPLTELPNRRSFIDVLNYKIKSGKQGAVILLDLDDFKLINDTRGHVFGDRVLETIAKHFKEINDRNIFTSRFGGDEFLFLIEFNEDQSEIEGYVKQINGLFSDKMKIDDIDMEIRYSMGIALFPYHSTDVDQLIMDADLAMYAVKNTGKNGYKYYDSSMMEYQLKISNIESILKDAIKNDGFDIVYQPQVEVKTGRITDYEALLRLKYHSISPAEFIDVAEKNGHIIKIGRIVTQKVIEQLYEWMKIGLEMKPVAINFSANQLHDVDYIKFIKDMLEQYGIESKYLKIEITENIFLENQQETLAFLKQLKEMGIKIAIDDFGTGYSSLNYLTFLPVDILKLDRSLNMKFLELDNVKVIVCLISLVHSLGLTVVAEGIETLDQVKILKRAYCDHIQGYYFSKPLKADQIPTIHTTQYHDF